MPAALLAAQRSGEMPAAVTEPTGRRRRAWWPAVVVARRRDATAAVRGRALLALLSPPQAATVRRGGEGDGDRRDETGGHERTSWARARAMDSIARAPKRNAAARSRRRDRQGDARGHRSGRAQSTGWRCPATIAGCGRRAPGTPPCPPARRGGAGEGDRLDAGHVRRAGREHRHPVREHHRLGDRVGDEQDGRLVALPQPEEQVAHLGAGHLVEGGERLVHQQDRARRGRRPAPGATRCCMPPDSSRGVGVEEVAEADLAEQRHRLVLAEAAGAVRPG